MDTSPKTEPRRKERLKSYWIDMALWATNVVKFASDSLLSILSTFNAWLDPRTAKQSLQYAKMKAKEAWSDLYTIGHGLMTLPIWTTTEALMVALDLPHGIFEWTHRYLKKNAEDWSLLGKARRYPAAWTARLLDQPFKYWKKAVKWLLGGIYNWSKSNERKFSLG
jgi:hypothetical protein